MLNHSYFHTSERWQHCFFHRTKGKQIKIQHAEPGATGQRMLRKHLFAYFPEIRGRKTSKDRLAARLNIRESHGRKPENRVKGRDIEQTNVTQRRLAQGRSDAMGPDRLSNTK